MLCISRREGETLVVDGPATIKIQRLSGRVVRLAIDAPKTTKVLRGELERRPEGTGEAKG